MSEVRARSKVWLAVVGRFRLLTAIEKMDQVRQILVRNGFERKFWKVASMPGKPVLFGLPGSPAATFESFSCLFYAGDRVEIIPLKAL